MKQISKVWYFREQWHLDIVFAGLYEFEDKGLLSEMNINV